MHIHDVLLKMKETDGEREKKELTRQQEQHQQNEISYDFNENDKENQQQQQWKQHNLILDRFANVSEQMKSLQVIRVIAFAQPPTEPHAFKLSP